MVLVSWTRGQRPVSELVVICLLIVVLIAFHLPYTTLADNGADDVHTTCPNECTQTCAVSGRRWTWECLGKSHAVFGAGGWPGVAERPLDTKRMREVTVDSRFRVAVWQISDLRVADSYVYTCRVQSSSSQARQHACTCLLVVGTEKELAQCQSPKIFPRPANRTIEISAVEGQAVLNIPAFSTGYERYTVRDWEYLGGPDPRPDEPPNTSPTKTIKGVRLSDAGQYRFELKYSETQVALAYMDFVLTVHPDTRRRMQTHTFYDDKQFDLTCPGGNLGHVATMGVEWTTDGKVVGRDETPGFHKYDQLVSVEPSHIGHRPGNYTISCKRGNVPYTFLLAAAPPTAPPQPKHHADHARVGLRRTPLDPSLTYTAVVTVTGRHFLLNFSYGISHRSPHFDVNRRITPAHACVLLRNETVTYSVRVVAKTEFGQVSAPSKPASWQHTSSPDAVHIVPLKMYVKALDDCPTPSSPGAGFRSEHQFAIQWLDYVRGAMATICSCCNVQVPDDTQQNVENMVCSNGSYSRLLDCSQTRDHGIELTFAVQAPVELTNFASPMDEFYKEADLGVDLAGWQWEVVGVSSPGFRDGWQSSNSQIDLTKGECDIEMDSPNGTSPTSFRAASTVSNTMAIPTTRTDQRSHGHTVGLHHGLSAVILGSTIALGIDW